MLNYNFYIEKDKSFVDDLIMERSIVSMRVGFVLRSAEIQLLFLRFVILILLEIDILISPILYYK